MNPEERLALRELIAQIDVLPKRHRGVLLMRMYGMTLMEIAKKMGITRERVRQIQARAHGIVVDSSVWGKVD